MDCRKVVLIGGSAGAIPSLVEIARRLPGDFPAPIFVAVHVPPHSRSLLPSLLTSVGNLHAVHPADNDAILAGHIYVAPPDFHLFLTRTHIRVTRGPKENHHRPAIDPLFRSGAAYFGANVIAVLLSGFLDDGTAGLMAVSLRSGYVIVQEPNDTMFSEMPLNALDNVTPNFVGTIPEIIRAILLQAQRPAVEKPLRSGARALREEEAKMVEIHDESAIQEMPGILSVFVCPKCNGALWMIEDGKVVRFRCHEGHAFLPMSMAAGKAEALASALWTALRTLEEKVAMSELLASRARLKNQPLAVGRFEKQSQITKEHADNIRVVLRNGALLLPTILAERPSGESRPESQDAE